MSAEYRLTGRVETGELAELYKAVRGREPVMIKLFHPRTSDAAYARHMAETARALMPLGDARILHVLELGLVKQRLAMVREDVGGFSLGQALQRLNTKEVVLPPPLALTMIIDLLELVQRAHAAGVIHGAITPGNVLLSRDGRLSVCDFGALIALEAVPALKKVFGTRGRAAYRAPEVGQGEQPSQASDVYSLGAIAYELLTLREPRSGKAASVSTRHEPLPPPSRLDRRINSRLDPIIMRAIDPSAPRRFRACGEMANALRTFITASGGMPSRNDAVKFVSELFPNEVSLQTLGPVPFSEPFTLSEVRGADLVPVGDRSMVLSPRPSFSGGEVAVVREGEDTSEHTPEDSPVEEPNFDDGTAPGQAGPLEQGWHAPPGAAPAKRVPLGVGPTLASGSRAAIRRVRIVEDFQGGPERSPTAVEIEAAEAPEKGGSSARSIDATQPIPGPRYPLESSDREVQPPQKATAVVRLLRTAQRRTRLLVIAGAVALVGLFSFGLVLWRLALSPEAPAARPETSMMNPMPIPVVKVQGSEDEDRGLRPIPRPPEPTPPDWHLSPRKGGGCITITSNVPAQVFIDGQRVRKGTPLTRYGVAAGTLKLLLVNPATGERRELPPLRVEKGKCAKIEELFAASPGRH